MDPQLPGLIQSVAGRLGIDPGWLDAIIRFETAGTYSPSIVNRIGATGLIQFLPSTAASLGTSTTQLATMDAPEQMEYVYRYFAPYRGRLKTIEDAYMAVLWPAAIGQSLDYVLWRKGSSAYEANKGLDRNGDGTVTKREAASIVVSYYRPQETVISLAPPQDTAPEEVVSLPTPVGEGDGEEVNTTLVAGIGIAILALGLIFGSR